jgi:hypothetical protein
MPGASYCWQNLANGGVSLSERNLTSVVINTDDITKSYHNQSLNFLSVVHFTEVQNYSSGAIKNIFIDSSKKVNISDESWCSTSRHKT